jgi:anti-sigma factor RsiW
VVERIDDFERELKEQLQARPAPEGFTQRVMARVPERRTWKWLGLGMPAWRWAVVTLLVAGMVLGGLERDREQRVAGERAREQVLLALRITGSTLRDVQQKVNTGGGQVKFSQKGAGRTVLEKDEQ